MAVATEGTAEVMEATVEATTMATAAPTVEAAG